MTSRRQANENRYDHALPFIQEAADEYYGGNIDKGFRHWAFSTVFALGHDIQGDEIVGYTGIDGSDDFEIDGYYIPESDDDSVVHLFQSKHRKPKTTMGPRELATFQNAPNRILNASEVNASRNAETKSLHEQIVQMTRTSSNPVSINLVWVTSGLLSAAARRHATENASRTINVIVDGTPIELTVTLQCLDLIDLCEQHDTQLQRMHSDNKCDFTFMLEPGTYHETNAEWRTVSMTVPVKQIIDVFARHKFKIFRENPRGPLGNKVNASIKNTLNDPTMRHNFHLLNNGITAICLSWALSDDQLVVQDFQIINGCQTTVTLWDRRIAVRDDPHVLVTVKLIECPNVVARTIARTTNSQAALRAEDYASNDHVQARLQQDFDKLTPRWFYQVKRGEWGQMVGGQREKQPYVDLAGGYRQLDIKGLAQAVVAFAGFPGEAKDNIRSFFDKKTLESMSRESSISYEEIFNERVRASQLLLPTVIQRKVRQQVAVDKDKYAGLDYARFHIIWLIGDMLREHYGWETNLLSSTRAESLTLNVDHWFKPVYDVALLAIDDALQELREADEFTGYRELFRTAANYRLIQSKVRGVLRLSSNVANPMANLPA